MVAQEPNKIKHLARFGKPPQGGFSFLFVHDIILCVKHKGDEMDTTNLPKTRQEAKDTGAKYYFTGEPCKYGHIAPRKTKGSCVECLKVEWEKANVTRAEYFREYNKSEAGQQAKRKYYEANKETVIAKAANRSTEERRSARNKHKRANPDLYKELVNMRRYRFKQATPKWLTPAQKMEIRLKYRLAIEMTRATGVKYVVDHKTPLIGQTVSGLHVPWNLEVITQEENLRKSNKLVDTPSIT